MGGLGKIQRDILLQLKCHPDRYIQLIQIDYEDDIITITDEDHNDYVKLLPRQLQSLIDRELIKEASSFRPALGCTKTIYKLNKQ